MTWEDLKLATVKKQPIESIYYYRLQLLNYKFMVREISKEQATEEKKVIEQEFLQSQDKEKNLIFFKHLYEMYLKYEKENVFNINWHELASDMSELCEKYGHGEKWLGYCLASIFEYLERKWNNAQVENPKDSQGHTTET